VNNTYGGISEVSRVASSVYILLGVAMVFAVHSG
jgi:hypothetical protein